MAVLGLMYRVMCRSRAVTAIARLKICGCGAGSAPGRARRNRRTQPGHGDMSCSRPRAPQLPPVRPLSGRARRRSRAGEGIVSFQPTTEYGPPGWYPDPAGRHGVRWWDGAQWGRQGAPLRTQGQEPGPMYPPRQSYGQRPRQPSFTPKAQYGALPGQLAYRGQPSCPPQPRGGDPYPQGPCGQQPYPPRGHSHQEAPGKPSRGFVWVCLGIRRVVVGGRHLGQLLLRLRRDGLAPAGLGLRRARPGTLAA